MPIRSALWNGWIRQDVVAFSDFPAVPTPVPADPEPTVEPVILQFPFWGSEHESDVLQTAINTAPQRFSDFVRTFASAEQVENVTAVLTGEAVID